MKLTLYYMPRTRAVRVRWLLEELQLPYQLETVDLFRGEGNSPQYRAIHPLGMIPALGIDDDIMVESGAICHWLADQHPDRALAPSPDSPQRREYEQWMYFAVTTLELPAWEIVLHGKVLPEVAADRAVSEIIPFATARYREVLAMLDGHMGGREYLVNNIFSAADIMTGYTLMWLPDLLAPFPALLDYTRRLSGRPAFIRANRDRRS
jgi:glutathione S-transferase